MNALLIGLALSIGAPALKTPKSDPSPVGEWTVEASVVGGKSDGVMDTSPIDKIVITADRWIVVRSGDGTGGTPITLDPKKNPPVLDINPAPGGRGGSLGIYKLEGDMLIVCYTLSGDRPTKVESPPDSQVRMMTLKRIKK